MTSPSAVDKAFQRQSDEHVVARQTSTSSLTTRQTASQHHLSVSSATAPGQHHLWARLQAGGSRLYIVRGRPRSQASCPDAIAAEDATSIGGGDCQLPGRSSETGSLSSTVAGMALHRRRRLILKAVNRSWPTSTSCIAPPAGTRVENGSSPGQSPGVMKPSPAGTIRRESFLYRSDSDFDVSPKSLSRASSLTNNDTCIDDVIVTPFAQILHCLRRIWSNYMLLTNIHPSKSKRALSKEKDHVNSLFHTYSLSDENRQQLAVETLEELEWCLDQLETTQTDRSVSDLATNKFKRMLSRELSHFAETSKSGSEISDYICHTFLEKEQEIDLPVLRVEHADSLPIERCSRPISRSPARSPCRSTPIDCRSTDRSASINSRLIGSRRHQNQTTPLRNGNRTAGSTAAGLGKLPKYGVEVRNEDSMNTLMTGLNRWGIDVFAIAQVTNNKPLTAIAYTILQERGLLKALRIHPNTLVNYMTQLEEHYRPDVSYHNSIHAADVTQTSHVMLLAPALENVFTELETLAVIFACSIHDVDHPGVSNQFLVQTGSELALIYNDESVLENHHLAVAFALLQREGCDIFAEFPKKQRQLLRRIVIDMVLATDMSRHMDHLAHLKTMVETRKISGNCEINMENYSERIQVLQNLIHCADLSNPAKPLELYRQWTDRITQEFFIQGDLERQLGIDISPMCDRQSASIDKTQIGFIDYIVQPLWETWSELVYPDCQDVLDALERNRSWYQDQSSASPPSVDGAPTNGHVDRRSAFSSNCRTSSMSSDCVFLDSCCGPDGTDDR